MLKAILNMQAHVLRFKRRAYRGIEFVVAAADDPLQHKLKAGMAPVP